jgi:hypothetical protein
MNTMRQADLPKPHGHPCPSFSLLRLILITPSPDLFREAVKESSTDLRGTLEIGVHPRRNVRFGNELIQ